MYSLLFSKAVSTSKSPTMIGDEKPLGAGTFHFTFLVGPTSTGGVCPAAIPEPAGPRNCGHAGGSPPAAPVAHNPTSATAKTEFMAMSLYS